MRSIYIVVLIVAGLLTPLASRAQSGFDVRLRMDFESAEKAIALYEGLSGRGSDIAALKGSQIALGTTAILARRHLTISDLERHLDAAKFGQAESDDVFKMKDAREYGPEIKSLLEEIKKRNFGQRVIKTVEQLFPSDIKISTTIPMYFVAFGHQNIDAYVQRVVWRGNTPIFTAEGELTIVVNLAKTVMTGRNVEERFIGTLSIVAHEVFHAAFGVYKDTSPLWSDYNLRHHSNIDRFLDLTQNEGIAHFLTFEQRSRGYLPNDWDEKVRRSINQFNKKSDVLFEPGLSPQQAFEIIQSSNTSGYWESYGAITGLFIAREINRAMGRQGLAETIAAGPASFFQKYIMLCSSNNNLPPLSENLVRYLLK